MKHREVILGYVSFLWVISVFALAGHDMLTGLTGSSPLLGNVSSVSASVPSNEFNSLLAQLETQKKDLDARSAALTAREQAIVSELDARQTDRMNRVYQFLFGFTLVLFLLVCVNYYLDYHRTPRVG